MRMGTDGQLGRRGSCARRHMGCRVQQRSLPIESEFPFRVRIRLRPSPPSPSLPRGRVQQRSLPIADELDWLCAAVDDMLRAKEDSSARCGLSHCLPSL